MFKVKSGLGCLVLFIFSILFQIQFLQAEEQSSPSVEDLMFISGTWEGTLFGAPAEEFWLSPKGGVMTGVFQLSPKSGNILLEFFIIEETPEGIIMRWKHYSRDYSTLEKTPTTLKLSSFSEKKAVFDMLEKSSDLPDRFIFERLDENHLTIWVGNTDSMGKFIEDGSIEAAYSRKK